MQCRDSNSRSLERESPPITTKPGHPSICFIENSNSCYYIIKPLLNWLSRFSSFIRSSDDPVDDLSHVYLEPERGHKIRNVSKFEVLPTALLEVG